MIQRRDQVPPNDEVRSDGDDRFVGVNLKLRADLLPAGICAAAVNKTFRDGRAATRDGLQSPIHFQVPDRPETVRVQNFGTIDGEPVAGDYPDTGELAAGKAVYRREDGLFEITFDGEDGTRWKLYFTADGPAASNYFVGGSASSPTSEGAGNYTLQGTAVGPIDVSIAPAESRAIVSAGLMAGTDGREFLLVALPASIWQLRDGRTWNEQTMSEQLDASTGDFVQFAGRVLLFRGPNATRLRLEIGSTTWELDTPDDPGDGTLDLPNATTAEVINNRLAVIQGRNEVILSDIARFRYDPLTALFRINTGANETLVRLLPFTSTSMLVFTTRSIYLLQGITGTLSGVSLAEVNRRLGLAARLAVAQVGADVFFLAREGVFRVQQVVESRIATAPVAVSDAIEPFLRNRVNWRAVSGACACAVGEYFYLAVPIDGSTTNNALLPYNLTTQQWEGWHTFPEGVSFARLLATDYQGRRRLFGIDPQRYVYLVGEGGCDRIGTTRHEISDELTTRGYTFEGAGFKTLTLAEVTLDTWRPSFNVALQCEGVSEQTTLAADQVKSRTTSYKFAVPAYALDNSGDDHGEPGRQDYSVLAGDGFELQSGIIFGRKQQTQERFRVRANGRFAQLIISSTQGRCDIVATRVEARHKENRRRIGF